MSKTQHFLRGKKKQVNKSRTHEQKNYRMEKMSAPRAVHCHFPFSSQENVTLPDPTTTPSLKQCPAVFEEYEELRGFSFSY